MADFVSSSAPISSSGAEADDTCCFDDVCSICLEPFNNSHDPPTVTNCKHEYHLQCILEWSQRSKECPICWQILALKDPASQELLAAVQDERSLRSRVKAQSINEDQEINYDAHYVEGSEFDGHIVRNFAGRIRYVNRRGRQRSSGVPHSQLQPSSPEEFHISRYDDSAISGASSASIDEAPANMVSSVANVISNTFGTRDYTVNPSHLPPDSPRRPNSSESITFPESIKSKFSAVSARYKESISKSTQGFKEKLLAHNSSVKELSKEVHREMSAGIAGVTRMIERLDFANKRNGGSAPSSIYDGGTSNFLYKGKGVVLSNHETTRETANDVNPHPPEGRPEASLLQKLMLKIVGMVKQLQFLSSSASVEVIHASDVAEEINLAITLQLIGMRPAILLLATNEDL